MLSRVVVRCASRASFNLQPVTFKHGQQSPASQDAPVITRPVEHEDKGKHRQDGSNKRREDKGRSQWGKKSAAQKSWKPLQANFQERAMMSKKRYTDKHDDNLLEKLNNKKRNRYIVNSTNQSIEENLKHLGINVSGEVIYGIFPVFLALQAERRKLYHLIYKNGKDVVNEKIQNILNIGEEQGIPITSLKPSQFKKIFQGDQVHQGVCCDVSSLPFTTLEEDYMEQRDPSEGHSQQGAAAKRHELWLYLDNIQDPMNFGAVLRSAYFMGVSRVITSNTNSVKVTNTVSKASAGVAEIFPVHQVEDPVKLASSLTSAGWEVISSSSPGSGDDTSARLTNVTTFTPKSSILLIVGNEGKGITPELQQMCHTVVNIAPGRTLHPHLQCLNVSVATALLLHSLRQRLDAVQTLDGPTHLER